MTRVYAKQEQGPMLNQVESSAMWGLFPRGKTGEGALHRLN